MNSIFIYNSYSPNFVNHCIKQFLNKLFSQRDFNFMFPKMESISVLPHLGETSPDLRIRLIRTLERNLLRFKDSLEKKIHSGIIFRNTCINYKVPYYGKHCVTFTLERLNAWKALILQENALKTLSNLQYLAIYCSVISR